MGGKSNSDDTNINMLIREGTGLDNSLEATNLIMSSADAIRDSFST